MPNDNTAVCGCGVVLDLPKSRNGMSTRNYMILIPKGSKDNNGGKQSKRTSESMEHLAIRSRGPNSRASDTGSTSSVAEFHSSNRLAAKGNNNKKDKRFSSGRRTRSAERISESHYTYIGKRTFFLFILFFFSSE